MVPPALPVIDVWRLIRRISKTFLWNGYLGTFLVISVGVGLSGILYQMLDLISTWVFSNNNWDISQLLYQLSEYFSNAPFASSASYALALDKLIFLFDLLFTITFWFIVSMPAIVSTVMSIFLTLMVKKIIAHDVKEISE